MLRVERLFFLLLCIFSFVSVLVCLGLVMRPESITREVRGIERTLVLRVNDGLAGDYTFSVAERVSPANSSIILQNTHPRPTSVTSPTATELDSSAAPSVRTSIESQNDSSDTELRYRLFPKYDAKKTNLSTIAAPMSPTLGQSIMNNLRARKSPSTFSAHRALRYSSSSSTWSRPAGSPPPQSHHTDQPLHRSPAQSPPVGGKFMWPSRGSQCTTPNCLDLLPSSEKFSVTVCEKQTLKHVQGPLAIPTCRFVSVSASSRAAVALNSQEGSGNTWLRGLLEKATGVCTGFYTCDVEMRAQGFLGEGVKTANVLVVKTHVHIPQWVGERRTVMYDGTYGSAVFLIRNPARGVIAEWNRLYTATHHHSHPMQMHSNIIPESEFATDEWVKFSGRYMERWKERTINWVLNNNRHPVHVVNYEDLQNDTVREVEKILDFLHFPYSHNELVERLRDDFTAFQRVHKNDGFQHFSPEQKEQLRETITELKAAAKAIGKAKFFLFDQYLVDLKNIY